MENIKTVSDFLDGKKTYIGAGIIFLAGGLRAIHTINDIEFQVLTAFGTSVTVVGIRAAINKIA